MTNKYWVHIHSTTSYLVDADSEEQAEEAALKEWEDNPNLYSENFINQEDNKIEISLDTSE